MTGRRPPARIRRRRHEAAAHVLAEAGWKPSGRPEAGTQRYASSAHPEDELIVVVVGALYWARRGSDAIVRQAARRDGSAIAAALDAARRAT